MIRLLGLVSREKRSLLVLSQNLKTNTNAIQNGEDTFGAGVSTKLSQLDSGVNKVRLDILKKISNQKSDFSEANNKFYKKKTSSKKKYDNKTYLETEAKNANLEKEEISESDDSDNFGTLTNEFKNISFLNKKIGYSKSLTDNHQLYETNEQNEIENQYEKVLSHIRLSNSPKERENTKHFYVNKMREFEKKGKIKEAIDVFFKEMIEKDRFKPTLWVYKELMSILAKAGYTHMVFTLFKRLLNSRQDEWIESNTNKTLHQIITLLFHSCAKCEWPEYAIKKTDSIRVYLKNRSITPNRIQYTAMISAYGRSGALYEAFNCVDEMLLNGTKPNIDIFNNLLCGCINHKNVFGFKYALAVWQMCLKFKIRPNIETYNLLLRAAKDCQTSDYQNDTRVEPSFERKILSRENNLFPINTEEYSMFLEKENNRDQNNNPKSSLSSNLIENLSTNIELAMDDQTNKIHQDQPSDTIQIDQKDVHIIKDTEVIGKSLESQISNLEWWQEIKPNIDTTEILRDLSKHKPELREIVKLNTLNSVLTNSKFDMKKANLNIEQDAQLNNYEVLGGIDGLCMALKAHKVKPDFKFFNTLLLICPNDFESEEKLLAQMSNFNITPDIDFCNFLIKRRLHYKRKELENADMAFKMIQKNKLTPNIITFGCLAYKIRNRNEMEEFFQDLKNMGFQLNIKIVATLYTKGFKQKHSFGFLLHLFEYMKKENVCVDDSFIKTVENDLNKLKMEIINMEKQSKKRLTEEEKIKYTKMANFYESFKNYFTTWSKSAKVSVYIHPYEKFSSKNDPIFNEHMKQTQKYNEKKN